MPTVGFRYIMRGKQILLEEPSGHLVELLELAPR